MASFLGFSFREGKFKSGGTRGIGEVRKGAQNYRRRDRKKGGIVCRKHRENHEGNEPDDANYGNSDKNDEKIDLFVQAP